MAARAGAEHLGMVKTGGNDAAAVGPTLAARKAYGIDQVLFCPGGEVQETGAANFLLIREGHILTRSQNDSVLRCWIFKCKSRAQEHACCNDVIAQNCCGIHFWHSAWHLRCIQ